MAAHARQTASRQVGELDYVAAQSSADLLKCLCDAAGQSLHPSRCTKGNQGNDKRILNQILTLFGANQEIEPSVKLVEHIDHRLTALPSRDYSSIVISYKSRDGGTLNPHRDVTSRTNVVLPSKLLPFCIAKGAESALRVTSEKGVVAVVSEMTRKGAQMRNLVLVYFNPNNSL